MLGHVPPALMTRAFSTLFLFLIAICECDGGSKAKEDEAQANWTSLLAAIADKDQHRADIFVGKTVHAAGVRHDPGRPLRLAHKLADGRLLVIRLTATFPSPQAKREVEELVLRSQMHLKARIIGPLRSVNVDKAEIVIEPVTAEVAEPRKVR
jgi:hypothetical protein